MKKGNLKIRRLIIGAMAFVGLWAVGVASAGSAQFAVETRKVKTESKEGKERDAKREKARYYFIQGSIEAGSSRMPQAYEYFKRAYEIDPDYDEAAFTYGNQRLFNHNDTLQSMTELIRSMQMMVPYVDRNPLDLYAAQMYGLVTTALDTLEEAIRVYENTYRLLPTETQLLQQLADAYMRTMQGDKALETLDRFEAIEGKSKDLSLRKITIKMALQDTVGAVEEVESLIRFNPRDPYSVILKGNLYEVIGKPDSVYAAYKAAEAMAPENGAVKMSLANYYRNEGDSVMLDKMTYEALLSEDLELDDKLAIMGEYLQKLLEEKGDRTRGDHLFNVVSEQYPHEPEVLEMSARYSAAKGDFEAAAEAVNYAVDLDPTNEHYWIMLLSFDITDDNYEKGVADYERAKAHFEPSIRMKRLYSGAASMLNDRDKTEKIIRELLEETDARLTDDVTQQTLNDVRRSLDYDGLAWVSNLYSILGDMFYKEGKSAKAFENYDRSLYFLNDNALALNNYAYFLSEEDMELEKALEMSKKALELSEENATYLDTYAWILYKLGDYEGALEAIEKARKLAAEQGDDNEEYEKHYEAIKKCAERSTQSTEHGAQR